MKLLRRLLDRQAHHFEPGGRLEKLYALWEAQDTILYTPGQVTAGPSHVRDGLDLKRMMMTVVIALAGCVYMAFYNTGYRPTWRSRPAPRTSTPGKPPRSRRSDSASRPTTGWRASCTGGCTTCRCWS